MNAVLAPAGLPVYLVHTSNPSVPNHPTAPATAFALVHAFSLLVAAGQRTWPPRGGPRNYSFQGLDRGFAQRSQSRRTAWPNRVYVVFSRYYGRVVHFRQLPTPCCHDAVAVSCQASERFAWWGLPPHCVYALTGARARTLVRRNVRKPLRLRIEGCVSLTGRSCGLQPALLSVRLWSIPQLGQ
jgi:hypothetical protein